MSSFIPSGLGDLRQDSRKPSGHYDRDRVKEREREERDREAKNYMKNSAPRDAVSRQFAISAGPQRQSTDPLRDRRSSFSPHRSHSPNNPRQRSRSPTRPAITRIQSSIQHESAPETTVRPDTVPDHSGDAMKSFIEMFTSYAKEISIFTSLELRKDQAEKHHAIKCTELEKVTRRAPSFPAAIEKQNSEKQKAREYLDKLKRELKAQKASLSNRVEQMAARVVPSNQGADPAQLQALQDRCERLEKELETSSNKRIDPNRLVELNTRCDHLQEELIRSRTDFNNHQSQTGQTQKALSELKDDICKISSDLETQNLTAFNDLSNKIDTLTKRINRYDLPSMKIKQDNDIAQLRDQITKFAAKVDAPPLAVPASVPAACINEAKPDTFKTDIATAIERLKVLEDKCSSDTAIEDRLSHLEAMDIEGMQNTLGSTRNAVEKLVKTFTESGDETHQGQPKDEGDKVTDNVMNGTAERLQRIEEELKAVHALDRRVVNLEELNQKHLNNFRTYDSNTKIATEAHDLLEARVAELECGVPQRSAATAHDELASNSDSIALFHKQSVHLKEQANIIDKFEANKIDVLLYNPDSTLSAALAAYKRLHSDLMGLVNAIETGNPDENQLWFVDMRVNALEIRWDLILFRCEQEERDMLLMPELNKIQDIDRHNKDLKRIDINLGRISGLQESTSEQTKALKQDIGQLQSRIDGLDQQSSIQPSNNSGFQQNHPSPQFPQQFMPNGIPNGNMYHNHVSPYSAPASVSVAHLNQIRQEFSTQLDTLSESLTLISNNLEHRMNNLSTGHITKFIVDHMYKMYPDVRNASDELHALRDRLRELNDKHDGLQVKVGDVERVAKKTFDFQAALQDLQSSQDMMAENIKILDDDMKRNIHPAVSTITDIRETIAPLLQWQKDIHLEFEQFLERCKSQETQNDETKKILDKWVDMSTKKVDNLQSDLSSLTMRMEVGCIGCAQLSDRIDKFFYASIGYNELKKEFDDYLDTSSTEIAALQVDVEELKAQVGPMDPQAQAANYRKRAASDTREGESASRKSRSAPVKRPKTGIWADTTDDEDGDD